MRFHPPSFSTLARRLLTELDQQHSILGIPEALWFRAGQSNRLRLELGSRRLATPFGVAAGPHSQLAGNIIAAWLCGARIIELKTVQHRAVEVSKPCIEMRDEGLNVEWSQELDPEAAFDQYLDAWVLIHALHARLGMPGSPAICFDLSVGYDLEGMLSPIMQRLLTRMSDAGKRPAGRVEELGRIDPSLASIHVPRRLASSVTLSTMHGCPAAEIARLATHLMEDHGYHTRVKLNPTLLGAARLRSLLNQRLGFVHLEPDERATANDLRLPQALPLLDGLCRVAVDAEVRFGVKLSNTLPVVNHGVFGAEQSTMYMSGRPLHPITVLLARTLSEALDRAGITPPASFFSFSGGADCWNAAELLACGLEPITVCSDLLRPGGYARLGQYVEHTTERMAELGAADLAGLRVARAAERGRPGLDPAAAARFNLACLAEEVLDDPAYHAATYDRSDTKSARRLHAFDCIQAPCTEACPVGQDVPGYLAALGGTDAQAASDTQAASDLAAAIICRHNPMPSTLGRACHHPCERRCTRTHLDEPLAIRELKRHAMVHGSRPELEPPPLQPGPRVAVVGAGPCGLSAALELRRHGVPVTVLERRERAGGMVTATIPGFRATEDAVQDDLTALEAAGVEVRSGVDVGGPREGRTCTVQSLLDEGFEHVIVGGGAQRGAQLGLEGEASLVGVMDGLELLRQARAGTAPDIGRTVLVIGGGDVAVDCARTARRLSSGEVRIVYRRTVHQMPAQAEELRLLAEEGIAVDELLAPLRLEHAGGRLVALQCQRMRLVAPEPPGAGGRPRPEPIPGAEHRIEADTLIIAIGQQPDLAMFGDSRPELTPSGWIAVDPETLETSLPGVFAGGDIAADGPATIVAAAADGRRIARHILERAGIRPRDLETVREPVAPDQLEALLVRRSRRQARVAIPEVPSDRRASFREVVGTLEPSAARTEAARCLACDRLCSTCVTVCPNRALFTYRVQPAVLRLPVLRTGPAGPEPAGESVHEIRQELQVALIADLCNGCGNCRAFCPTAGAPYLDKPRVHLDPAGFDEAGDGSFWLSLDGEDPTAPTLRLATRRDRQLYTVSLGESLDYDGPDLRLRLDRTTHEVLEVVPGSGRVETTEPAELSLEPCATLVTLLEGIAGSMPGLLAWAEAVRFGGADDRD